MSGTRPCFTISFTRLYCWCSRFSAPPIAVHGGCSLRHFSFQRQFVRDGAHKSSLAWRDHTTRRDLFSGWLGMAGTRTDQIITSESSENQQAIELNSMKDLGVNRLYLRWNL